MVKRTDSYRKRTGVDCFKCPEEKVSNKRVFGKVCIFIKWIIYSAVESKVAFFHRVLGVKRTYITKYPENNSDRLTPLKKGNKGYDGNPFKKCTEGEIWYNCMMDIKQKESLKILMHMRERRLKNFRNRECFFCFRQYVACLQVYNIKSKQKRERKQEGAYDGKRNQRIH